MLSCQIVTQKVEPHYVHQLTLVNPQDWYSVEKVPGIKGWVELREHKRSIKLNLTNQYLAFMVSTFLLPFTLL